MWREYAIAAEQIEVDPLERTGIDHEWQPSLASESRDFMQSLHSRIIGGQNARNTAANHPGCTVWQRAQIDVGSDNLGTSGDHLRAHFIRANKANHAHAESDGCTNRQNCRAWILD